MRQLFKSKIFKKQFIAFMSMIIIILGGISIPLFTYTKIALMNNTIGLIEMYRDQVRNEIKQSLSSDIECIDIQTHYLENRGENFLYSKDQQKIIEQVVENSETINDIIIIDEQGDVINSVEGSLDFNLADRSYVINGLQGKSTVTEFFKGKKTGAIVVAIGEPIYFEGESKYVLAAIITLDKVQALINSIHLNHTGKAYLVDKGGNIIGNDSISEEKSFGLSDIKAIHEVIKNKQGVSKYENSTGQGVLGAYDWIDILNVGLVIEVEEKKLLQPIITLEIIMVMIGVIALILGSFMAYGFSKKSLRPIYQLIDASKNISNNQYQTVECVKANSELDILVQSFNQMQMVIQDREQKLIQVNEELQIFRRVIEQINAGIVVTNLDAEIQYVNFAFEEMTGYKLEEIKGKTPSILKSGQHPNEFYEELWKTILSGQTWKGEFINKKKNGEYYYERALIEPITNEKKELFGFAAVKEDITREKKIEKQLEIYATKDELTQVYNRRTGIEFLKNAMEVSKRSKKKLSIIFVDVNDLKYVNDHLGHNAGDKLILLITQLIKKNLREVDILARLGGDEFLMILPDCSEKDAHKIWSRVEQDTHAHNDKKVEAFILSASYGVAEYDSAVMSRVDEFIEIADKRMYKYKEEYKKNRKQKNNPSMR